MRNGYKNIIVGFPVALLVVIILGCGGNSTVSSSNSNDSSSSNISRDEENQYLKEQENEENADQDKGLVSISMGEEATIDNLQVTVLDYKFSDYADGESLNKVQDGLKYCVVYLKVKNLDNEQKELGNSFKRAYTSTLTYDKEYKYHSTWTMNPQFFFANDTLPALGEIECIVTFEVAKDVEDNPDKEMTFTFELNDIWKDQETKIWVLREDNKSEETE